MITPEPTAPPQPASVCPKCGAAMFRPKPTLSEWCACCRVAQLTRELATVTQERDELSIVTEGSGLVRQSFTNGLFYGWVIIAGDGNRYLRAIDAIRACLAAKPEVKGADEA